MTTSKNWDNSFLEQRWGAIIVLRVQVTAMTILKKGRNILRSVLYIRIF